MRGTLGKWHYCRTEQGSSVRSVDSVLKRTAYHLDHRRHRVHRMWECWGGEKNLGHPKFDSENQLPDLSQGLRNVGASEATPFKNRRFCRWTQIQRTRNSGNLRESAEINSQPEHSREPSNPKPQTWRTKLAQQPITDPIIGKPKPSPSATPDATPPTWRNLHLS